MPERDELQHLLSLAEDALPHAEAMRLRTPTSPVPWTNGSLQPGYNRTGRLSIYAATSTDPSVREMSTDPWGRHRTAARTPCAKRRSGWKRSYWN
jgi:hypothetical protein